MKKSKFIQLLALSLVLIFALTSCKAASGPTPLPGATETPAANGSTDPAPSPEGAKIITIAQTGDWDSFMPMNTTNSGADAVIELMFDRLMVINKDGTFAPRLASSWETNEESNKITFHLNENAKWQDGEPVTADDVVFSAQVASTSDFVYLRRIRMEYFAGTDESGMELTPDSIEVVAIDDHTVEFTLKTPMDPTIIYALVNRDFFIIPKHLLANISEEALATDDFWQAPIGSGPCKFDSHTSGERVEFTANKDYFLGTPDFDRLIFRKVLSPNLLAGFMSGEIDVLSGNTVIPLQDWEAAQAVENVTTASVPSFGYQYMGMNTSRAYLSQEVRQALDLAINREVLINQLMMGEGLMAAGPLSEEHSYFNTELLPYEYDPDKAIEALAAAGWDNSRVLEVLVPTGNELREKSAILVQQDLEKIGVKTQIQTLDFPTLLNYTREGNFDLVFIGSAGSVDPSESVPNVTVGYMNNFAQLTDPTLGDVGASGAKLLTFDERKPVYDKYQMLLKEQMPMAFLYFQNTLFAHANRVSGIPYDSTDYNINKNVWEWKVA